MSLRVQSSWICRMRVCCVLAMSSALMIMRKNYLNGKGGQTYEKNRIFTFDVCRTFGNLMS